ncbi:MAG: hypothetical protein KAQ91_00910 [Methylococcales bacterium]|nr:hypothetical protein [Methylococcales bacterium]
MEENYLIGLFVAFIFSFVLFKKDSTASTEDTTERQQPKVHRDTSGATGVARYLQEKQGSDIASPAVSGVAKYLAGKENAPVSGVSKYMARQAIHAKKMAKENVSGVERYLNNRG